MQNESNLAKEFACLLSLMETLKSQLLKVAANGDLSGSSASAKVHMNFADNNRLFFALFI